ncbi:MAG: FkbM family methyltransferase [Kiritimatiellia bacterium]
MPVPSFLRKVIHRLPAPVRHALRRSNSLRIVRSFTPAEWDYHAFASRHLRPGDCAVDAGANIGYISRLLADLVGPSGRLHSFEPVRETREILAHCMRTLGYGQVTVHAAGVSDHSGLARVSVPDYAGGGRNYYESAVTRDGSGGEEVSLVTLDECLAGETRPVRFIKIDVEGHELEAVRGARALIARWRPALLIEIQGDPSAPAGAARELFDLLRGSDYLPFLWRNGDTVPWRPGQNSVDYVFLPATEAAPP